MKIKFFAALALAVLFAGVAAAQNGVLIYRNQGGTTMTVASGGLIDVDSGGEIDVNSGGTLDVNGTADFTGATVTSLGTVTTADINGGTIDGATIGGSSAGAGTFTTGTVTTLVVGGDTLSADVDDEVDRIADDSGRINVVEGTTAITCATHGTGQINYISSTSAAFEGTLPAATGSGCVYEFTWANLPTQAGVAEDVIQVTGDDEFVGVLNTLSDDSAAVKGWAMADGGDNDKLSFSSSTKYAATVGVGIKFKDVAADQYAVEGTGSSTGSEATPAATGQRP